MTKMFDRSDEAAPDALTLIHSDHREVSAERSRKALVDAFVDCPPQDDGAQEHDPPLTIERDDRVASRLVPRVQSRVTRDKPRIGFVARFFV